MPVETSTLILASNSPRRKQLMAAGGWRFTVLAAEVDETPRLGEMPTEYVLRLAEAKARQTAALDQLAGRRGNVIIAADTTVALEGEILGKPADFKQAEDMLRRLRDRWHQVISGVAVLRLGVDETVKTACCLTEVRMRAYSEAELRAYLATGDSLDKAGAYAIQHPQFKPVDRLRGCFSNVMGLPVCLVRDLLAQVGQFAPAELYRECGMDVEQPCWIYRRAVYGELV